MVVVVVVVAVVVVDKEEVVRRKETHARRNRGDTARFAPFSSLTISLDLWTVPPPTPVLAKSCSFYAPVWTALAYTNVSE